MLFRLVDFGVKLLQVMIPGFVHSIRKLVRDLLTKQHLIHGHSISYDVYLTQIKRLLSLRVVALARTLHVSSASRRPVGSVRDETKRRRRCRPRRRHFELNETHRRSAGLTLHQSPWTVRLRYDS